MLSVERLNELADDIMGRSLPPRDATIIAQYHKPAHFDLESEEPQWFSLAYWLSRWDCGTVGCIAGTAVLKWSDEADEILQTVDCDVSVENVAVRLLSDNTLQDAATLHSLFCPVLGPDSQPYHLITPETAALAIRHTARGNNPCQYWINHDQYKPAGLS